MAKVIAVQSSPNEDGLTCLLARAVLEGAETELIHLNKLNIESCKAHNRGWGTCRSEGKCMVEDDFQNLREKINQADAFVFSTPVYFGDISESAKRFFDRWRRCEIYMRETSPLRGKTCHRNSRGWRIRRRSSERSTQLRNLSSLASIRHL